MIADQAGKCLRAVRSLRSQYAYRARCAKKLTVVQRSAPKFATWPAFRAKRAPHALLLVRCSIGPGCSEWLSAEAAQATGRRPRPAAVAPRPGFMPPPRARSSSSSGHAGGSVPPRSRTPSRPSCGDGEGWVTAEYAMLPRSSPERIERERAARGADARDPASRRTEPPRSGRSRALGERLDRGRL
jgi:hypothetical protein